MPETNCPQCERRLKVPEDLLGRAVKCPTCGTTFTAALEGAPPQPAAPLREEGWRTDDYPPRDGGPARRQLEDFGDRRDDYDDRPQRRRDLVPHRGTLILVLGIIGIVACNLTAPVAWIMGSADLAEIRAGRMDLEGEGLTQAGMICGIIGTVLLVLQCCFVGLMIMAAAGA